MYDQPRGPCPSPPITTRGRYPATTPGTRTVNTAVRIKGTSLVNRCINSVSVAWTRFYCGITAGVSAVTDAGLSYGPKRAPGAKDIPFNSNELHAERYRRS